MFPLRLPACLTRPFGRRPCTTRRPARAEAALEERLLGCGWFDSSHELQRGLRVREHDGASLAAGLPLATWLDWHLAGGQAAAGHPVGHTLTAQQRDHP